MAKQNEQNEQSIKTTVSVYASILEKNLSWMYIYWSKLQTQHGFLYSSKYISLKTFFDNDYNLTALKKVFLAKHGRARAF